MPYSYNAPAKQQGIDAQIAYTRTGKVKGISYALEEARFTGTLLGKHYTFQGLQKYKGVQYKEDLDQESWGAFGAGRVPADATQIAAYLQLGELLFDQQEPSVAFAEATIEPAHRTPPSFAQEIPPDRRQTELAQQLYPDLAQVWNRHKKQSKEVLAGARVLKGNNYALICNSTRSNLWIVHRQRGILAHYKNGEVELAQKITPDDLANFSQIAAAQPLSQPKSQQKSQMER